MVQDQGRYDSTDSELDFDHYSPSFNEDEKWVPPPPTNDPDPEKPSKVFYYIYDEEDKPVITVCLLHCDGVWTRGVAVWTPANIWNEKRTEPTPKYRQPNTRLAENKAKGRAEAAWLNRTSSREINRVNVRQYVYKLIGRVDMWPFPSFKSEYMPTLTYMERKLLFGLAVAREV